jgi:hypothetical protein
MKDPKSAKAKLDEELEEYQRSSKKAEAAAPAANGGEKHEEAAK